MTTQSEDHGPMHPARLETEAQFDLAFERFRELTDRPSETDSPADRELKHLIDLIADYERRTIWFPPADPIDVIEFRLDQMGMTIADLVPLIGSIEEVDAVMTRQRPLTLDMIRLLRERLAISADILIREFVISGRNAA